MDEKYYNTIAAENKGQMKEINERKNEIMRMSNPAKRQTAWDNLYPKLPVANIPY